MAAPSAVWICLGGWGWLKVSSTAHAHQHDIKCKMILSQSSANDVTPGNPTAAFPHEITSWANPASPLSKASSVLSIKVVTCKGRDTQTDNASGSEMWRVVQVGVVKVSPHLLLLLLLLVLLLYIYIYATQPPVTHHGLANGPFFEMPPSQSHCAGLHNAARNWCPATLNASMWSDKLS